MTLAKKAFKDYRIPLLAVLIFVIMSLVNKNFFTPYNIFTIADSISGYGIVALGFTFILLVGQLDISFGSVIALSACIFMMMLQAQMNFLLALLAAIAVGCACGAVTGFFVATFLSFIELLTCSFKQKFSFLFFIHILEFNVIHKFSISSINFR